MRRARVLLGTLVEVGADDAGAIDAAFDAVAAVQSRMSRFEPASDVGRFDRLGAGESIVVDTSTAEVLACATTLEAASGHAFDVALGSGRWRLSGRRLTKLDAGTRLDLGGIAKGYAVDRAVAALRAGGCAAGHVNAGGDLRSFGGVELPVVLRDEAQGGVRPFCTLRDGALATSHLAHARARHVSVAAPACMLADALTKVVAATGHRRHPLLALHGAIAWLH